MASPTSTVPGAAADCRRLAVLTRSPATIPWLVAPMVTAASPVSTPGPRLERNAALAERGDARDQLERGADRSLGVVLVRDGGAPQTAITASPMNFSTVPPCRSMTARAMSK